MFSGSLLAIVLLFAGVVILFKTVRMVPQGYEWTVERFGRYTHTLTPGLHFLVPVMYGVGRKINMMEQVLEVPSPGRDHQGQRGGQGRRHRVLPGARRGQGGLRGGDAGDRRSSTW